MGGFPRIICLTAVLTLCILISTGIAADLTLSEVMERARWDADVTLVKAWEDPPDEEKPHNDGILSLSYNRRFGGAPAILRYAFLKNKLIHVSLTVPKLTLMPEQTRELFDAANNEIRRQIKSRPDRSHVYTNNNSGQFKGLARWFKNDSAVFLLMDPSGRSFVNAFKLDLFKRNEPANQTIIDLVNFHFQQLPPKDHTGYRPVLMLVAIVCVFAWAYIKDRRRWPKE